MNEYEVMIVHTEFSRVMLSYWGKILIEKVETRKTQMPALNFTLNKCYKLKTSGKEWAGYAYRLNFVCKPKLPVRVDNFEKYTLSE